MKLIRKDVFDLTIPILTEQVFVISMGMINTMMAGHIGKEAVSAIGMVDSINYIFIYFFSALAIGGTVVVAQYVGQGNIKRANAAMKQALYSSVLISLMITGLMWIFRYFIINSLFGSAEMVVKNDAYIYLGITLFTYPLITVDLVANGILRGAGDTKTPMKISIFMNFINVILSYIFIYGLNISNSHINMHINSMGVKGAAIGIAIARSIGAFVIFFVLLRGSEVLKLKKLFSFKFDTSYLKAIYGIGIPASIESLLFNGGKLITQIFVVDMGTISIAANTIVNSITNFINIPGNSLSTAATALVGQYMGKEDDSEASRCLSYITKLSTICLALLGTISFPLAGILSSLYTNNIDIVQLSVKVLKTYAFATVIWPIAFVLPSGMKGAGDVNYTLVTSIIGMWAFRITLGYILGITFKMGLVGIWLGMYVDWIVRGILYCMRFRNGLWKKHVVIQKTKTV